MSVRSLLRLSLTPLLLLATLSTVYLYLYPLFHSCSFPTPSPSSCPGFRNDTITDHESLAEDIGNIRKPLAPFRLLVLADPQLEGDSSLPDPDDGLLPRLSRHWEDVVEHNLTWADRRGVVGSALSAVLLEDIPKALQALRKRVDLFGNDYYLAHIYRTLHWWTDPSHVTVLGDLIGSQWVTDGEFEQRGQRYWNRVFAGGHRIEDDITQGSKDNQEHAYNMSDASWATRIVNIAGNHDIGYAGDISQARIERFERTFGRANWDLRFEYPKIENISQNFTPSLHLIVLNTLNLDTPALDQDLQSASYDFINSVITAHSRPVEDRSSFTLLLTHLPLHKPPGVCVDPPYFDFWDFDDADGKFKTNGVKEQNHLSDHGSRHGILEGIFGLNHNLEAPGQGKGRSGLILTGHDHEGCDTWHYIPAISKAAESEGDRSKEANWQATQWRNADHESGHAGIREITLRSMMGEFGGNAGLLSAWFDFDAGKWRYDIQMCKFGVQHIWWAVHVLDIVTVAVSMAWAVTRTAMEDKTPPKTTSPEGEGSEKRQTSAVSAESAKT